VPHPISIRFPPTLRQRVAAQAAAERRSFGGQVRLLVEGSLAAREAAQRTADAELLRQMAETFGGAYSSLATGVRAAELAAEVREVAPVYEPCDEPATLTFHSLRHAAASRLIRAGLDPLTVASVLGHEDATTTLSVYAHMFDRERTDEAVRAALAGSDRA
jgi:site-specific recombinase XerC